MSVEVLRAAVSAPTTTVLSLDIFDTVVLRDGTTQAFRFVEAATLAARRLGVDPGPLTELRLVSHDNAYRAIQMERPGADARFASLCRAVTAPLGLGAHGAAVLAECELEADIARLKPNPAALALISDARAKARRVIAVSDTWYSADDIARLLDAVVGEQPFDAIYTSADLGTSKQGGGMFDRVAVLEGCPPGEFLHVGDTLEADQVNAAAAGWNAAHLPRSHWYTLQRVWWKLRTIPLQLKAIL
ncbi:HAD family hydrolase [Demequina sp. NBRC 110054]|uniref:HAD family hydrolase n=1 Tax=Demequina sp. NBRC 110054 TaxID=1570343 RepID=UPI0011779A1B|nr:HAD family hydrolase [Demequina sp. NBRC 110054]